MNKAEFLKQVNSGALSCAYLLHGEEQFFKESAIHSIEDLIPEDLRAFNLTVLYEPDLEKLTDTCETLPLFSEKTLVIARELAKTVDVALLGDYIERMSSSTVLLIVCKDKLEASSALLKLFAKIDRDVLFGPVDPADAIKWCMKKAVSLGVDLNPNTARLFVGIVGSDMSNISNELQKLIDLVGEGGSITPDIVSANVIGNIETKVFTMLDCFTAGKVQDGMRSLRALLTEDRDAPRKVIGFIESRFKVMLQGKLLMDSGLAPKQAAGRMEGNSYANEKACRAAAKYSAQSLRKIVSELSLIVYNSITNSIDPSTAVETLMIGFDWNGTR